MTKPAATPNLPPAMTDPTTPAKTLDKAQWAQVKAALSHPWGGSVHLVVDGLNVTLQVRQYSALQFCIVPFVDGTMQYGWFNADCQVRRLLGNASVIHLYGKKAAADFEKKFGKRAAKKHGLHKTFTSFKPTWNSVSRLLSHLRKAATSIELVSEHPPGKSVDEHGNALPAELRMQLSQTPATATGAPL